MYLLVFHVCRTSGSLIPFCAACQSKKSNKYLMAFGNGFPLGTVNTDLNRSSTKGCRILCITSKIYMRFYSKPLFNLCGKQSWQKYFSDQLLSSTTNSSLLIVIILWFYLVQYNIDHVLKHSQNTLIIQSENNYDIWVQQCSSKALC